MVKEYVKNKPALLDIIENLKKNNIATRKHYLCNAPKLIFVCGKSMFDKDNNKYPENVLKRKRYKRLYIMKEFEKRNSSDFKQVISLLSEDLFSFCHSKGLDLLTFEEILAEISYQIINIVESMGTACELGAFSIEEKYLNKMVVLNLDKFADEQSFIHDGPIKKIRDRNENNIIVIKSNLYYLCNDNDELDKYLNKVKDSKIKLEPNNDPKNVTLISLIYELLNILDLFGKIRVNHLFKLYKYLKGFSSYTVKNGAKYKIKVDNEIVDFMSEIGLVDSDGVYVNIKNNIRCEDALFKISKLEYEHCKLKIMSSKSKEYVIESLKFDTGEAGSDNEYAGNA